jgi:hypothetical protein
MRTYVEIMSEANRSYPDADAQINARLRLILEVLLDIRSFHGLEELRRK